MVLAWLSKVISSPVVANVLVPTLAKALSEYFQRQANRLEEKAANTQAKAAGKIADNAKRAEALRLASIKLTEATRRN